MPVPDGADKKLQEKLRQKEVARKKREEAERKKKEAAERRKEVARKKREEKKQEAARKKEIEQRNAKRKHDWKEHDRNYSYFHGEWTYYLKCKRRGCSVTAAGKSKNDIAGSYGHIQREPIGCHGE